MVGCCVDVAVVVGVAVDVAVAVGVVVVCGGGCIVWCCCRWRWCCDVT